MSPEQRVYTTQLHAGLGLIDETQRLLSLYETGCSTSQLYQQALDSGLFPKISARRLRNIVVECFAPRYIKTHAAAHLKPLVSGLPSANLQQLFLIYTAEANAILHDFILDVYWPCYAGGVNTMTTDDAKAFVRQALRDGKTLRPWSESTIQRVSSYLVGCCADYGLLSAGRSATRRIQPVRLHDSTVLYLAYRLHFQGLGDQAVLQHPSWALLGLDSLEVREELKRLAKNGGLIVQSAGAITRISWPLKTMEDVIDVIVECGFQ